MRELVDERDLRAPLQDRVDVHLLERRPAVGHLLARNDLEIADLRGRLCALVRLDEADHDVLAVVASATALVQHRVGLPDAGPRAEIDTQLASGHTERLRLLVEREVEFEDVYALLAEEAERAAVRVLIHEREDPLYCDPARAGNAHCLATTVLRRNVRVESGSGGREGVDRRIGLVRLPVLGAPV